MPVWQQVSTPAGSHWADDNLFRGWVNEALSLAAVSQETRANAADPEAQRQLTLAIWRALGNAYLALNFPPHSEPNYRQAWSDAYNVPPNQTSSPNRRGWMSQRAIQALVSFKGEGFIRDETDVIARVGLRTNASTWSSCLRYEDEGCGMGVGTAWTGRAAPSGAACADPGNDWRCMAWNDAPLQPLRVAPPLQWSWDLGRRLAEMLRGRTAADVLAVALPDAQRRSLPTTLTTGGGQPATAVPDPPGFRRDPPPPPPPTQPPFGFDPNARPIPPGAIPTGPSSPALDPGCSDVPARERSRDTVVGVQQWNYLHPSCPVEFRPIEVMPGPGSPGGPPPGPPVGGPPSGPIVDPGSLPPFPPPAETPPALPTPPGTVAPPAPPGGSALPWVLGAGALGALWYFTRRRA